MPKNYYLSKKYPFCSYLFFLIKIWLPMRKKPIVDICKMILSNTLFSLRITSRFIFTMSHDIFCKFFLSKVPFYIVSSRPNSSIADFPFLFCLDISCASCIYNIFLYLTFSRIPATEHVPIKYHKFTDSNIAEVLLEENLYLPQGRVFNELKKSPLFRL